MVCPNCNAKIPEKMVVCPNCNMDLQTKRTMGIKENVRYKNQSNMDSSMPVRSYSVKNGIQDPVHIIGILSGTLLSIAGVIFFIMSFRSIEESSFFGGDFYTYIYDGICLMISLISCLIRAISVCMVIAGVLIDCHFMSKDLILKDDNELLKNIEKNLPKL